MSFRTRIVRVRPKRGQKIELLRAPPVDRRENIEERVHEMLRSFESGVAGFAFVAWDPVGQSAVGCSAWDTAAVPKQLLAEYVRNCLASKLVAETIEHMKEA